MQDHLNDGSSDWTLEEIEAARDASQSLWMIGQRLPADSDMREYLVDSAATIDSWVDKQEDLNDPFGRAVAELEEAFTAPSFRGQDDGDLYTLRRGDRQIDETTLFALRKAGYVRVAEVKNAPDGGLLRIPGIGPKRLASIREADSVRNRIREHRGMCGWTLAVFAEAIGAAPEDVVSWERGAPVPLQQQLAMCELFGFNAEGGRAYLMGTEDDGASG
jgi:DNA-binding XRE family transcriptional regulator